MNALSNDLQAGFEILWYQIESVLGRGGFGITYLAMDKNLGQWVAIKEYLPHDFAARRGDSTVQPVSVEKEDVFSWGLERFMIEAQTLAKFKHPNIVRVLSVFKHNNTGYMVMEYEQGDDLGAIYEQKKTLSQRELEDNYYPIIDGLSSVHNEGFIHRDIKPSNIYIRADHSPVLIDFGAARQAVGSKTKTLTSMLSIGYAPFEQYNDEPGKQGPWTDIYALGASLHQGITGEKPMESTIRGMALLHNEPDPYEPLSHSRVEGYSPHFLRAIDQALMMQIHDRPQNLEDFLGMLRGEILLADIPDSAEQISESTAVRDRTVVRPAKRKLSGAEVETNSSEIKTSSNPSSTGKVKPKSHTAKAGLLANPKALVVTGIILVIIVIVGLSLPREPSPEEIQQQKINSLFEKADDLIANGQYFNDLDKGALGTYHQIIAIEPNNSRAKNGVHNVVKHFLTQAEQHIGKKDFAQADASLKIVNSIDPGFPGLKEALARYSETLNIEKRSIQIEAVIGLANTALEQGRIHEPNKKNALYYYESVLKLDPENETAQLALFQIADILTDQAQKAVGRNDLNDAEKLTNRVESITPENSTIKSLRQQISRSREVNQILSKADKAYAQYRFTTPIEGSAYELYSEVLSLAPSNPHAQSRLNGIADFYSKKSWSSIQRGNLTTANANLESLEKFFPDNTEIAILKSEIAKKQLTQKKVSPPVQPKSGNSVIDDTLLPVSTEVTPAPQVYGTYISDITTDSPWAFDKKKHRTIAITFAQQGNEITGVSGSANLKITGTLKGDEITFFTWPSDISSFEIKGKWKISADGTKLTGKWSHPGGGGKWNLTKTSLSNPENKIQSTTIDSVATPKNETPLPSIDTEATSVKSNFTGDISGTYISDITTDNSWIFDKRKHRTIEIIFAQQGNGITGINGPADLKITGTLKGDEITFFTWPSDISSDEINGKWKISADGTKLTGKWSHPFGGGKWNLTRITSENIPSEKGDWKPARGEWRTEWGSTTAHARLKIIDGTRATYDYKNGRILFSSIDKKGKWEGYWVEDRGTSGCGNAMKDDSKYWGKITFQFNDNYTRFKGTWDNCGKGRKRNWNGYR